jgi:hypothetical protein
MNQFRHSNNDRDDFPEQEKSLRRINESHVTPLNQMGWRQRWRVARERDEVSSEVHRDKAVISGEVELYNHRLQAGVAKTAFRCIADGQIDALQDSYREGCVARDANRADRDHQLRKDLINRFNGRKKEIEESNWDVDQKRAALQAEQERFEFHLKRINENFHDRH